MKRLPALINMISIISSVTLVFSASEPIRAGGWGVTTLDDLPQVVVAGQKTTIGFMIRQHGRTPLTGITPVMLFAHAESKDRLNVIAKAEGEPGHYVATVIFPKPGQWSWKTTSWPEQRLPNLTVVDKRESDSAQRQARLQMQTIRGQIAHGQVLFVAKGCFMCHRHDAIEESGQFSNAYEAAAPDLTHRGLTEEYLSMWLKDPRSVRTNATMPNLNLKESEIESLISFLNATRSNAVASSSQPPAACPITRPQRPEFSAPPPNSAKTPWPGEFWYGTQALWTVVPRNGVWSGLPHNPEGYTQKVWWWRKGYSIDDEPQPKLTVTGRRLDAPAPPLNVSRATNGFAANIQYAMLVGVDFPTLGCWEITGVYSATRLSFVVWVAP